MVEMQSDRARQILDVARSGLSQLARRRWTGWLSLELVWDVAHYFVLTASTFVPSGMAKVTVPPGKTALVAGLADAAASAAL